MLRASFILIACFHPWSPTKWSERKHKSVRVRIFLIFSTILLRTSYYSLHGYCISRLENDLLDLTWRISEQLPHIRIFFCILWHILIRKTWQSEIKCEFKSISYIWLPENMDSRKVVGAQAVNVHLIYFDIYQHISERNRIGKRWLGLIWFLHVSWTDSSSFLCPTNTASWDLQLIVKFLEICE